MKIDVSQIYDSARVVSVVFTNKITILCYLSKLQNTERGREREKDSSSYRYALQIRQFNYIYVCT